MRVTVCLLVGVLVLPAGLLIPATALAQDQQRHAAAEFGLGVGAVVCTVPYGIAKSLYAVFGSAIGGLAWLLTTGDRDRSARSIIQPAVRGDYVITPEHLTNQRVLRFVGRDPLYDPNPYQP